MVRHTVLWYSNAVEREEIIARAVKIIRSHLAEEYKVFLFGSWARGDARETSDIDIGILGPSRVQDEVMMMIRGATEALPTLRSVDIVDLGGKSDDYKERVLGYAKVLN